MSMRPPRPLVILACLLASISCAYADAGKRLIIPTDHDSVIQWLGKAAESFPKTNFTRLGGNGLDQNIVIRQAAASGVQYNYIVNPAWWPVKVTIKLDCPDSLVSLKEIKDGKAGPAQPVKVRSELHIDLDAHQAAMVTVKPPAVFLSAEVEVPAEAQKEIADKLTDLALILPHLPTRRPNLIVKNPGFEKIDSHKMPYNWHIFNWHRTGSVFGFDTGNVCEGTQSFFMDNAAHGKTVGIASDRFRAHPSRAYEFSVRLGTDAKSGRARIGFTGARHLTKEVAPDNIWREFSICLWPEQSKAMAASGWLRAEVHNDAKGILWVDDAKVVDATICDTATARKIEALCKRLADCFSAGDYVGCFQTLQEDVIQRLLAKVAKMKKGSEWLIAGPFLSASDADLAKAFPPEKDVLEGKNLRETEYSGRDGIAVGWVTNWTTTAAGSQGYMDLCAAVGPFDDSIAYAYTKVQSGVNQKVKLLIGSDDGIVVWLNGKCIHAKAAEGAAKPAEDAVDADLKLGWNEILLKIRNSQDRWGFFFTVADENQKPLRGIKYAQRLLSPTEVK